MKKALNTIRENVTNTLAVVGIFTIVTANIPYKGYEWFYFAMTALALYTIGNRD